MNSEEYAYSTQVIEVLQQLLALPLYYLSSNLKKGLKRAENAQTYKKFWDDETIFLTSQPIQARFSHLFY